MELHPDTCRRLQELDASARNYRRKIAQEKDLQLRLNGTLDSLRLNMGFRERYLAGWFGGDTSLVAQYQSTVAELAATKKRITLFSDNAAATDALAKETAATYAAANDPAFARLNAAHAAAALAKSAAEELLAAIDTAAQEISEASTCETLDLVSKNKGLSILSHLETTEAREAIREVERAAERFQKALGEYRDLANAGRIKVTLTTPDDTLDLVCDLTFDPGLDLLSLFNLAALHDAADEIEQLRPATREAHDRIAGQFAGLDAQRDEIIGRIIKIALRG